MRSLAPVRGLPLESRQWEREAGATRGNSEMEGKEAEGMLLR